MHTDLITTLLHKRLVFPLLSATDKGDSKAFARQLDLALMQVGFKLSKALLRYVSGLSSTDAFKVSGILLPAVQSLVGDHVKHNVYFRDFPKNVPDTLVFWSELLAAYYEQTGVLTNNLLSLPGYGTYQLSYEEMVEAHDTFKPRNGKAGLKVINLGGTEQQELNGLFLNLAGSVVPLNEEDRTLLGKLFAAGFRGPANLDIPVRENKAIINALWLAEGEALDVDTPTDVLRLAAHLSGGDVTLTENTRFKSLRRPVRRALMEALDGVLDNRPELLEDITSRREQFKRLGEKLHPHEFRACKDAIKLFSYARGDTQIVTWGHKVHAAIENRRIGRALSLLAEKPGQLVRRLDKLARESSNDQFDTVVNVLEEVVERVSGRVLLSLIEHLDNRTAKTPYRLFVNKAGSGWAAPSTLAPLAAARIKALQKVLWKDIGRRLPAKEAFDLDPRLASIALPISEKTKSDGFAVLPRGSTFELDSTKDLVRFFIYWRQQGERTDYDLSAMMYDDSFRFLGQVSYTSLGWGGQTHNQPALHSGDITSAPNGASEFIDIQLAKMPANVRYVVPTVNHFAGHTYKDCAECFFGFMSRSLSEKGKPFEAKTVQTRFALRGEKKVAVPMVFVRGESGWSVKWLDLYLNGLPAGNSTETNRYSTQLLAKSLVTRQYLTVGRLMEAYQSKRPKKGGGKVYAGLFAPEGLPAGTEVYTLDNLKALIPA